MAGETRGGIVDVVAGIVQDLKTLVRQEAQLLRHEIDLELSKAGRAAIGLGIGIALALAGSFFVLAMLVHGLHAWTELPLWACYGLVGTLLVAVGGVLMLRARSLAGSVRAMPIRTMHAIKEDARWIKEHVMSNRT